MDCGLNVQLRTPSLCPNRGRARTLEAHGYYWRSHIRGPHQRHDTDLRGGGNPLYQLYQCAIPLRWTENRRSSNLHFPLESLKNLFSFQGETYCYYFGSCPFPRRARLVTGLKMPKKNHLGLIQQGVDAWNTWRERAAAQPIRAGQTSPKRTSGKQTSEKRTSTKQTSAKRTSAKRTLAGRTLARRIS